jgi:uncharacterized protein (TIGR02996 family)
MQSPASPDADALLRAALKNPADSVARLVLADWLEETGTKANVAWATYIRLREEATSGDATSRELALEKIHTVAPLIQARVTLKAADVMTQLKDFVLILPAGHFTLKLQNTKPPALLFRGLRENVLRNERCVPLSYQEGIYVFATAKDDVTTVADFLRVELLSQVYAMRAKWAEVEGLLDNHYHRPRGSVSGISNTGEVFPNSRHDPDSPLVADTAWDGILRVLTEARSENANSVEIMATKADVYVIHFMIAGRPQRRYTADATWGRELVRSTERLKWDPPPGLKVKVKDRNTFFGPGIRLVFE